MNFNIRIIALNFLILLTNTPMMCTSPAQNIGTQFMAATISNVGDFYRAQPNCNGAVGPKQYIQITNQNIRSFNKKTGQPDGILNSDSATFFGIPAADTMLTFDRWGQRWIMISFPTKIIRNGSVLKQKKQNQNSEILCFLIDIYFYLKE